MTDYKKLIESLREEEEIMGDYTTAELLKHAADAIEELTMTGKWKVFYDDDAPQDGFNACSECGFIRFHDDIFPRNYCPNCGADMRKEKE